MVFIRYEKWLYGEKLWTGKRNLFAYSILDTPLSAHLPPENSQKPYFWAFIIFFALKDLITKMLSPRTLKSTERNRPYDPTPVVKSKFDIFGFWPKTAVRWRQSAIWCIATIGNSISPTTMQNKLRPPGGGNRNSKTKVLFTLTGGGRGAFGGGG